MNCTGEPRGFVLPEDFNAEEMKMIQNEVCLTIGSVNEDPYTPESMEKIAKIQQERGEKAISPIVSLMEKGEIRPWDAVRLLRGIEAPDEVLYEAFLQVAKSEHSVLDYDHSAFWESVRGMLVFGEREQRESDFTDLERLIEDCLNDGTENLGRLRSTIDYHRNLDISYQREYFEQAREESRKIYEIGYLAYREQQRGLQQHLFHEDMGYGDTLIDDPSLDAPPFDDDYPDEMTGFGTGLESCRLMIRDVLRRGLSDARDICVDDSRVRVVLEKRNLESRELQPPQERVSLGIEVEVHPNKGQTKEKEEYTKMARKYEIRDGEDGVFEFSFEPVNNPEVLCRQIWALYELGYLNSDHRTYPMHLTVGGIEGGVDAHLMQIALASTGWSATGTRFGQRGPYQKGSGGIVVKGEEYYSSLYLPSGSDQANQTYGVEMRVFWLRSLSGLARTLASASDLGTALKAHQKPDHERTEVDKKLGKIWEDFRDKMEEILNSHDYEFSDDEFSDAHKAKEAMEKVGELVSNSWSNRDDKLRSEVYVHQVRKLLIETRKRVKDIFENVSR